MKSKHVIEQYLLCTGILIISVNNLTKDIFSLPEKYFFLLAGFGFGLAIAGLVIYFIKWLKRKKNIDYGTKH
jgi:hypothetical protein